MALFTPMISFVVFRVFNNSDSQTTEMFGLSKRCSRFTGMLGFGNIFPLNGLKRNIRMTYIRRPLLLLTCTTMYN